MKPPELRARWRDVYRSVAPDIGPDLLRRGIAYRLQERRQGSLASSTHREIDRGTLFGFFITDLRYRTVMIVCSHKMPGFPLALGACIAGALLLNSPLH